MEPPRPVPSTEELLLQCRDLASALRLLRADCLHMGLELLRLIQDRVLAILQHSTQVCRPARGAPERKAARVDRYSETWVCVPAPRPAAGCFGPCQLTTWHFLQSKGINQHPGYFARSLLSRFTWGNFQT